MESDLEELASQLKRVEEELQKREDKERQLKKKVDELTFSLSEGSANFGAAAEAGKIMALQARKGAMKKELAKASTQLAEASEDVARARLRKVELHAEINELLEEQVNS